jgi:hypothetical protein
MEKIDNVYEFMDWDSGETLLFVKTDDSDDAVQQFISHSAFLEKHESYDMKLTGFMHIYGKLYITFKGEKKKAKWKVRVWRL